MLPARDWMRGLYRYETAKGRWWACAEDENGARVHIERRRYEAMAVQPPFEQLPLESNGEGQRAKRSAEH